MAAVLDFALQVLDRRTRSRARAIGRVFGLLLVLPGCASEVTMRPVSTGLQPPPSQAPEVIRVSRDVPLSLATGYERRISARSEWRLVGAVADGAVYQPIDGVFTVEGANVHEAYLVLEGHSLVGFYLPVEGALTPLAPAVTLPIEPR